MEAPKENGEKMKCAYLVFLIFSLGFAQLIDYDYSHSTGHLYQIEQQDPDYYTSNAILYHLETQLSVPSSRWVAGSGSYSDVHDGDYVCTGSADYAVNVNAKVTGFSGYIPSYSGADEDPGDWPNCGCPSGSVPVLWSKSTYESYRDNTILDGKHLGASYLRRSISYRESGVGTPFTNEVAESATVMRGTSILSGGYSVLLPIYTFSPLSGTAPSHSGSITMGSAGDYTFIQRLDATGAVIGAYNPNVGREDYRAYKDLCTNPPSCSSQNQEYAVSNVHDSAVVHVVDDSDIGVIAPSISSVTLQGHTMSNGHYTFEPGESIPATIRVRIPARSTQYAHYLSFELDQAQALSPFSFTASGSGLNQCGSSFIWSRLLNGGWFGNSAYYINVTGTLRVPDTLPQQGGDVSFRVHWRTCSGEVDCSGHGDSGWTANFPVPYIPRQEQAPPDLACTLEPVSLVGGAESNATGLTPGQGVENWRLTIRNVGAGNLTIPGPTMSQAIMQYSCLGSVFNAFEQNSTTSPYWIYDAPGKWISMFSTVNDRLNSGASITTIVPGRVYCREAGGRISASAIINVGAAVTEACLPYEIAESSETNNFCNWQIPCVNETIPQNPDDNCTIHPSSYSGEVGGEYNFSLTCGENDHECTGAVDWEITEGGSISGNQTDATASVGSNESTLEITATVNNPDGENAVCYAHIFFNGEGDGENGCRIFETPQTGFPGSSHLFYITCSGEGIEDGECTNADWSIYRGEEFVLDDWHGDWFHWEGQLNQFAVNTTIIVEANVDFGENGHETCRGEIIVPEIPCIDYV